jgi:hypothetical protein
MNGTQIMKLLLLREEWYSENGGMVEKETPLLRKQSVSEPSDCHKFIAK